MRVAMFEQYSLIIASLMLGTLVGLILAMIVTAQFYLFLEYPFVLNFPWIIVFMMVAVSVLTSYYAVRNPVRQVNRRQIASVVKGL